MQGPAQAPVFGFGMWVSETHAGFSVIEGVSCIWGWENNFKGFFFHTKNQVDLAEHFAPQRPGCSAPARPHAAVGTVLRSKGLRALGGFLCFGRLAG